MNMPSRGRGNHLASGASGADSAARGAKYPAGMIVAKWMAMSLSIIAGSANPSLAVSIARALGTTVARRSVKRFPDGELQVEIEQSVGGHDVYIVQSTAFTPDEHLTELLFLGDACRRAGAARVTAVMPYFGYARQDRRASAGEALGASVVATLIEAVGFARIIAVHLHTPEIEGFFRIPVEHLSATVLLAAALRPAPDSVIVAPDLGAVRLAEQYQHQLNLPVATIHKTRVSGSEVAVRAVIGDVKGRAPIVVDDMITTGGTIEAAVRGLLDAGCRPEVSIAATHALFVGPALARLRALPLRQLIATDTVDCGPARTSPRHLQVVDVAPVIADAIRRIHRNESLEPDLAHH